jgi:hypothetical protein
MLIRPTHPNNLTFEDLTHLQSAIDNGGNVTLKEVLDNARNGRGTIFTCEKGALYLERHESAINLVLLGGEDIKSWGIVDFAKDIMQQEGVEHLLVMGRIGWHRLFKELEPMGTIFKFHNPMNPPKNS